jgi:hypothetical protein
LFWILLTVPTLPQYDLPCSGDCVTEEWCVLSLCSEPFYFCSLFSLFLSTGDSWLCAVNRGSIYVLLVRCSVLLCAFLALG